MGRFGEGESGVLHLVLHCDIGVQLLVAKSIGLPLRTAGVRSLISNLLVSNSLSKARCR
jgi:hypothetical protein